MKTLRFKLPDRITALKPILTTAACLFAGVLTSSATVTVQGWWRGGEAGNVQADSSTNGRNFLDSFSCEGGGISGAGIVSSGVGGPLGTTGAISTDCMFWEPNSCGTGGMWGPAGAADVTAANPAGYYNPPGSNYVIECWVLPLGAGVRSGGSVQFFASGSSDNGQSGGRASGTGPGGVYFEDVTIAGDTSVQIGAFVVANAAQGVTNDTQIGTWVTNEEPAWMHIAVVNDNGTNTFYVNGVQNGPSTTANTIPNYDIGLGTRGESAIPVFQGYLDECRISTFAPGAFSTNDFLLPPPGPSIVTQPQSETVWNGGAAPFAVLTAYDPTNTYQWQDGSLINGATNSELYLNVVNSGSNGAVYSCLLSNPTGNTVSSNVVLTVVPANTAVAAQYQNAVSNTPGLIAYYTVDNDTGSTLTDTIGHNNGTLEGTAEYDGRTNRALGVRALRFRTSLDGDVNIPNNPQFEFGNNATASGTIEAIVYLDKEELFDDYLTQFTTTEAPLVGQNETIFSEADTNNFDTSIPTYYAFQTSPSGAGLYYKSDAGTLVWSVPKPLLGRAAQIAFVFTNSTVTAYVDGLSLGTQANPGFGTSGGAAWIASLGGLQGAGGAFNGNVEDLAIYTNALSPETIALHNSDFVYGTNLVPPAITAFTGQSATLDVGGLASFSVTATGAQPLFYQWTSNTVPIEGATSATFVLGPTTTNFSATYGVTITNQSGQTNATFTLNFVQATNAHIALMMADHPLALWPLNEPSGTIAYDVAGDNNGTYSANIVLGQPGVPGLFLDAAHFNPNVVTFAPLACDVTVPFNPTLNPQGAFSIEYWAYPAHEQYPNYASVQVSSAVINSVGTQVNGYVCDNDLDNGDSWEITLANPSGESLAAFNSAATTPNQWYDLIYTYDGSNVVTYQNSAVWGSNSYSANGGTFAANSSAPLLIGNRADLDWAFPGDLQLVAIYNYALTPAQVLNHFEIPPTITQQPVGLTNVEGSTVTLSATVGGSPNGYQWYLNGNPLDGTVANTPDNTLHYPNGVTSASLVISEAVPTDSGTYYLAVTNPIENLQSSNATVLITPNTVAPTVTEVIPLGTPNTFSGITNPYLVKVVFSRRVDPGTAGNTINYSFSPALAINQMSLLGSGPNDIAAANLGADYRVAILDTAGMTPGQKYTLTITGVKDQSQTPLTLPTTNFSFFAPVMTPGLVNWDYYYLGNSQGGAVSALLGDGNYPNAPMTNTDFTAFDSDQITGGDLNNNPTFGGLGDNYGDVVSGWITPTVSGDYTFFLWTDDGGELDMSPDANPNNVAQIAVEASAGSGFTEPTNTPDVDSAPITLVAGHSYFIRTLHAEGGGGDYVKVAWRISTDSTPAKNLTPIPGTYLSTFAISSPKFSTPTLTNGVLTLNWSGAGTTIQASTNLLNWTNVPGNPSPLVVPVNSGTNALYFRLSQ